MCEPDPAFARAQSSLTSPSFVNNFISDNSMAPKKKPSEVGGPSASHPPPPEPTVGGGDAVGRVVAGEDTHGATRSKNRTDDRTSVSVDAPRPSQHTTTPQRHTTGGGIRLLGQGHTGGSRDAPDPRPGTSKAKAPARDPAPSNAVRSPSVSRSSHRSPAFPTTPAEALARAQLLLDFPQRPTRPRNGGPLSGA